ncbi:MAG TPA: hypothetical protein VJ860_15085 [Polyangia bacterium]|nr:hypothetical protein [Polyangia bacterium]
MKRPTYSIPIGIAVIAFGGMVATGCGDSGGLGSGKTDGGASDAAASLGGQSGSISSSGGAAGSPGTGGAAGSPGTGGAGGTPGTGGAAGSQSTGGTVGTPGTGGSGGSVDAGGLAGSKGTGGVAGAGGTTGPGGTKGCCSVDPDAAVDVSKPDGNGTVDGAADAGAVVCGPVCEIYCPYGNVLDANGCPTCSCNPPPCPAMKCASCPYGYVKDASGCLTCTCLPDPSLPCKPLDSIQCGNSTHCRWLAPSCGLFGTNLTYSESGCYDQVDCTTTSDCSETGSTCVDRMVAPPGGPGGDWCGIMVRICL